MRKLTKEEKELTIKNMEKNKQEIEDLKMQREYNKALIQKQREAREFDDKWREYLRIEKDKADKKVLDLMDSEIKLREETIKDSKKSITGVY